eukprot:SAG11_NODE_10797_length_805_cov_0.881020_1_plen_164_part_00
MSDDAGAIQKAIDHAQRLPPASELPRVGRPVYFPAGTYLNNSTLTVACTQDHAEMWTALPLRLYGDGMRQSQIVAGAPMDAVLRFNAHGAYSANGTSKWAEANYVETFHHAVENLGFHAAGYANNSVASVAIVRSQFRYSSFYGARVARLMLEFGSARSCSDY